MERWAGLTTPEDAAATTTLLRAPAAIAAAFFLTGAIAGQVLWSNGTLAAAGAAALRCLAVAFVCVPFLLASRRYRSGRTAMRAWIVAAAVAASIRSIYLCVSLFPLPVGDWLIAVGVQVALLGALWLAVFAVTVADHAAWGRGPRGSRGKVPLDFNETRFCCKRYQQNAFAERTPPKSSAFVSSKRWLGSATMNEH